MLLYTDGMVEEPRRDIDLGIDRMLGEAESLLRGSFDDAATRLADALGLTATTTGPCWWSTAAGDCSPASLAFGA